MVEQAKGERTKNQDQQLAVCTIKKPSPSSSPSNSIEVDKDENFSHPWLSYHIAPIPYQLVAPIINNDDNSVHTNLTAIQAIWHWYEILETQAMTQLEMNPFIPQTQEQMEQPLDVEMLHQFPLYKRPL